MISSNKLKKWAERQRRDAWDWLITTRRPNLNLVFSCCVCKIGSTYFVALENAPTATWIQCQTQLGFSFSGNAVFGFVWNGTGPKSRCRKQDVAKKVFFFWETTLTHLQNSSSSSKRLKTKFLEMFPNFCASLNERDNFHQEQTLTAALNRGISQHCIFRSKMIFFFTKITICRGFPLKFSGSGVAPEKFRIIIVFMLR